MIFSRKKSKKISYLALIESIIATSLSLWIAWEYNIFIHILIAISFAPFLLLRTKKSIRKGLIYFNWSWKKINIEDNIPVWAFASVLFTISVVFYLNNFLDFLKIILTILIVLIPHIFPKYLGANIIGYFIVGLSLILMLYVFGEIEIDKFSDLILLIIFGSHIIGFLVSVVYFFLAIPVAIITLVIGTIISTLALSLVCKIIATLEELVRNPLEMMKNIPYNWFNIVFLVNSTHLPEIIPGIEESKYSEITNNIRKLKVKNWMKLNLKNNEEKFWGAFHLVLSPIIYLPSLIYRYSLKSSSIIWLPLLWIVGAEDNKKYSLQAKLKIIRNSSWSKISVIYAFFVIFVLTIIPLSIRGKITLNISTIDQQDTMTSINNLISFFMAFQMDAWHWSRLIVALLTIMLFFYSDRLLIKREFNPNEGDRTAPYIIRLVSLFRIPLSMFTIACGFYLLLSPIDWNEQINNMTWFPFVLEH